MTKNRIEQQFTASIYENGRKEIKNSQQLWIKSEYLTVKRNQKSENRVTVLQIEMAKSDLATITDDIAYVFVAID